MLKKSQTLPLNIILLGDIGSGKGTQGEIFSKIYQLYNFDMGKELAKLAKHDRKIHEQLKRSQYLGLLTPTRIVRQIYKDTLLKIPPTKGIIFNGTPKMLGEAKLLAGLIRKTNRQQPLLIYLTIPWTETKNRVRKRQGYLNNKNDRRPDDSLPALIRRTKYYKTNVKDVVTFLKKQYQFQKINGMGSRQEVTRRMKKVIQNIM